MAAPCEWTADHAAELQLAANSIFEKDESLRDCQFSLSISDPSLRDCPFVGCSTGFSQMCGYEMKEVLGRNCRFLIDPVPAEYVDEAARDSARAYVQSVVGSLRSSSDLSQCQNKTPDWAPHVSRTNDRFWCVQVNARKDGTLFHNMFHLKEIMLGEKIYIIGLQCALPMPSPDKELPDVHEMYETACLKVDQNWIEVVTILSRLFWLSAPMHRQEPKDADDGFYSDYETCCSDCEADRESGL